MVLWLLVEGMDIAVMVRFTGHKDATIARWLERMGQHSQGLHNVLFRNLVLALVQLDELHAKVRDSEKAVWLWLAIDPVTKIIPSLHLGGRKREDACAVVHDLKQRLLATCIPAFLTDGCGATSTRSQHTLGTGFGPSAHELSTGRRTTTCITGSWSSASGDAS